MVLNPNHLIIPIKNVYLLAGNTADQQHSGCSGEFRVKHSAGFGRDSARAAFRRNAGAHSCATASILGRS
jgi:hypothetical protein